MSEIRWRTLLRICVLCGSLALAALVSSCSVLAPLPPSESAPPQRHPRTRDAAAVTPPAARGSVAPLQPPAPRPGQSIAPPRRQYQLGPAAAALIGQARSQERHNDLALAAETLERALSIEPHNPRVWLELARENILANNPAQAFGMGRKALYLASGDPRAQARAWEVIAASLREQGRNNAAYVAEQRAAALDSQ